MNDEAREVLVAAALRGHRQVRQLHASIGEGECAMGLLHLERHSNRAEAVACASMAGREESSLGPCIRAVEASYGISGREGIEIRALNDSGADFLTIARKVGHRDEPA